MRETKIKRGVLTTMKNVIIDVDTGVDDAIAILMAAKNSQFNILGITTVAGNVTAEQAAINTAKVLKLINKSNIPVLSGAEKAVLGDYKTSSTMHGKDGLFEALNHIEINPEDIRKGQAVDFLIKTIREVGHNGVTLILTAPLTNMALAINKAPDIIKYVDEIIIMGGAVNCSGNITPQAEFNIYKDPEGANIVINSGISITLITLDVTNKIILKEEHIEEIENQCIRMFLKTVTEPWINRYERKHGVRGCVMHDPLTIAYAINRKMIKTNKASIHIMTEKGINQGKMICKEDDLSPVNVSLDINENEFDKLFCKYINL